MRATFISNGKDWSNGCAVYKVGESKLRRTRPLSDLEIVLALLQPRPTATAAEIHTAEKERANLEKDRSMMRFLCNLLFLQGGLAWLHSLVVTLLLLSPLISQTLTKPPFCFGGDFPYPSSQIPYVQVKGEKVTFSPVSKTTPHAHIDLAK